MVEKGGTFSAVHDVFLVSMLRKYVADPTHVVNFESFQINENLSYEEQPVGILAREVKMLRNRGIALPTTEPFLYLFVAVEFVSSLPLAAASFSSAIASFRCLLQQPTHVKFGSRAHACAKPPSYSCELSQRSSRVQPQSSQRPSRAQPQLSRPCACEPPIESIFSALAELIPIFQAVFKPLSLLFGFFTYFDFIRKLEPWVFPKPRINLGSSSTLVVLLALAIRVVSTWVSFGITTFYDCVIRWDHQSSMT
ncbi:ABC transporter B family member 19-like [Cucumis melo var. makuwa]|uniref:ABC transporter B family member 19-like n=1 Tax=Cucumis melo var. makuwa TaxID=1194695 RepID=A0A5D3DDK4_CUCMM|nr:ABC transporter B family member 19-like [Cucumis melo var. makuwa]TYK21530.1 ABC transporter B family member 19-like [Cucumis melo var. makuwa]